MLSVYTLFFLMLFHWLFSPFSQVVSFISAIYICALSFAIIQCIFSMVVTVLYLFGKGSQLPCLCVLLLYEMCICIHSDSQLLFSFFMEA